MWRTNQSIKSMKYQLREIVLCEIARHLVLAKYSVFHSLWDITRLESCVANYVTQCTKCLERSIETHEVLVIRIYFLSTSNPLITLVIFNVRQEKPKCKYFNFLEKKNSRHCGYVQQILETGLEPCKRRWRKALILFGRYINTITSSPARKKSHEIKFS